jgi:hypothetical protein
MTEAPKFQLERVTIERPRPAAPSRPTWRERARLVIGPVVAANAGKSRREIRRALRAVYGYYADRRSGRAYKVWCDECAFALRERSRKNPARHGVIPAADVMPAMRAHVARSGRLEVTAELDIDFVVERPEARDQRPVDPDCLEGPGRSREQMAADRRELDRIAPTAVDKFELMFRGITG